MSFRKYLWGSFIAALLLAFGIISLPPVRIEYHKSRLQSAKARKARLLGAAPSGIDWLRMQLGAEPISGRELDHTIQEHEDALVRLGFLHRETLPAQMISACPQTLQTLTDLQTNCPWYHARVLSETNFVFTACSTFMDRWHARAKQLGW